MTDLVTPRKVGDADKLVAQNIRSIRKQEKITMQELANRLGVSYQQVDKYEKGANRISAGRLWEMAQALDVPISHFFPFELDPHTRADRFDEAMQAIEDHGKTLNHLSKCISNLKG